MDTNNLESKYQKLATEYSKLRAQASVLKKAVIEEQTKSSTLRDSLRQKETALRRSEQEVDSLGFRNKQLEHRVASLQDDFEKEIKKSSNKSLKFNNKKLNNKNVSNSPSGNGDITINSSCNSTDPIIFEELQKKIMENAMLTSLIDDKEREIGLFCDRIKDLEKQMEKHNADSSDIEKRLRKDLDTLHSRNSELETKLVEAASIIGSEDALSASGSDSTTPIHALNSTTNEDRIAFLEKEVFHWRTQYEILKITDLSKFDNHTNSNSKNNKFFNGPQQKQLNNTIAGTSTDKNIPSERCIETSKEQLLYQHFSKKFEELLRDKCMAESRLNSYITECENLQTSLDNLMKELTCKDIEIKDSKMDIRTLDEDLATTRINYEEQISVLTEQVITLSEQLASSR